MPRPLVITLLLVVFSLPVQARVNEFELSNGMKVIVKEDHRAPVVVSQIWYKVGSTYEHNGITGVSHVLEHMMFKGTARHPAGEFSRIIAENGGRENAFTARDYTAYFQQLHKDRLPIALELEADRMRNLQLPTAEFAKEVQVVMEERRLRTEDDPQALTFEQFNAAAFQVSPNRNPIIGWMDDLKNLAIEDLQAWYRRWYAPNNATLVVVGDVDPQRVLALARTHFGPLPAARIEDLKPRREPVQRGLRRITVKAPAQLPVLVMGYKTPNIATADAPWEPYALEVLAGVLDGGASARLARNLVRGQQIATSAGAGYSLYSRLPGLFTFSAVPGNGHEVAAVERALRAEIERIRTEPATADELKRVKTAVVASAVYQRDSLFYQAMQIGTTETIGLGHEVLDEYVARIQAVTAEQVQAVAEKYLVEDALTVAVLEPQSMAAGTPPSPVAGGRHGG
ncbi:MAG: insulinase family protein [Proteobacteria bacterium]|nr:MAG: insulinase family protein [Pseudomonadota bacterium]